MKRNRKTGRRPRTLVPEMDRFSPLLNDDPVPSRGATYTVEVKVWLWKGKGAWHFANLPKAESAEIRRKFAAAKRGWGSIAVSVRIGDTEWDTSLFPNSKSSCYMFAIKASVRQAEDIAEGSVVTAHVTVR